MKLGSACFGLMCRLSRPRPRDSPQTRQVSESEGVCQRVRHGQSLPSKREQSYLGLVRAGVKAIELEYVREGGSIVTGHYSFGWELEMGRFHTNLFAFKI